MTTPFDLEAVVKAQIRSFTKIHNPGPITREILGLFISTNPFRVRNLKFATYLKFATCENTNKINELW